MGNGKAWWASFLGEGANGEMASALSELVCGGSGPDWERAVGDIAASGRSASGMIHELARLRASGPAAFSLGLPAVHESGEGRAAAGERVPSLSDATEWAKAATVAAATVPGTALRSDQSDRLARLATLASLAGTTVGSRMERGFQALDAGLVTTAAAGFLQAAAESHGDHAEASVAYAAAAACTAVLGDWKGAEALVRTCTFLSGEPWGHQGADEGEAYRIFLDGILSAPERYRKHVGDYVLRFSERVFAPAFPSVVAACGIARCVHAAGAVQASATALSSLFAAAERDGTGLPFPDVVFAYGQSKLFPSRWPGMGAVLAGSLERQLSRGCGQYPLESAEAALYLSASGYPDEAVPVGVVIAAAARLAVEDRMLAAEALAILAPRAVQGPPWERAFAEAAASLEPTSEEGPPDSGGAAAGERGALAALAVVASFGTGIGGFPRRLLEAWTVAAFLSKDPVGYLSGARGLLARSEALAALAGQSEREAFPALLGSGAAEGDAGDVLTDARWAYLNAYETFPYGKCTAFLDRISVWTEG